MDLTMLSFASLVFYFVVAFPCCIANVQKGRRLHEEVHCGICPQPRGSGPRSGTGHLHILPDHILVGPNWPGVNSSCPGRP